MNFSNHPVRHGNGLVITIIALAIVLSAGLAVFLVWVDGAEETLKETETATPLQRDTLLVPVANWGAAVITEYAKSHDGKLPDTKAGNALIENKVKTKGLPDTEAINGFTATPIYRMVTANNFEIVLPTDELGGKAHLVYAYTASGESLSAVAGNVFLSGQDQVNNPLEEEPSPGIGN